MTARYREKAYTRLVALAQSLSKADVTDTNLMRTIQQEAKEALDEAHFDRVKHMQTIALLGAQKRADEARAFRLKILSALKRIRLKTGGGTLEELAAALNKRGYRNTRGERWTGDAVKALLRTAELNGEK